jgi:hypothetical protein
MRFLNTHLFPPLILLTAIAVAPVTVQAQKTSDEASFTEVKQETRDLVATLKSYGDDQRNEAVDAATNALFKLDNRIRDLQFLIDTRWDDMNQSVRSKARANLRSLQRQRVELAEWYGGLKSDSGAAWNDIKQGFSRAFSEINEGWEDALREFELNEETRSAS